MPPEISAALISLIGLVLAALAGYIGAWLKRQTDKANLQTVIDAKAVETKVAIETKTQEIKEDIEAQNLKERETIRSMVDFYVKRVTELTTEIDLLRNAFRLEGDGFRNEIITLRSEATECKTEIRQQKDEIVGLKAEITVLKEEVEAGHEREAKLRLDVNHMPEEINRLKAMVEANGGDIKSLLSPKSQALVEAAKEEAETDEPAPDAPP